MEKLEDLINILCPNGVRYELLENILNYEQPAKYIVKDTRYDDTYDTPVLTAGQTFILGYTDEKDGIFRASKEKPVIIFDDFTTSMHWVDFNFKVKSSAMKMLRTKDNENELKYIYYAMRSIEYEPVDHTRQWIEKYSKFRIPLPPLEIQRNIISLMDEWEQKQSGIIKALRNEISLRRKQHDYYNGLLLSFDDDVREVTLEDVCQIVDCPHTSPKWKDEGVPVIRNYNLVNGVIDTSNLSYVDEEEYLIRIKRIEPRENDILFSREAPIGNVGIVPKGFRCCQGQRVVLLRPQIDVVTPRYLVHVLQGKMVRDQIATIEGKKATVSNFNIADLKKLRFKVPNIEEQEKAVIELDQLNEAIYGLITKIEEEITLRETQYKYYMRDIFALKERTA